MIRLTNVSASLIFTPEKMVIPGDYFEVEELEDGHKRLVAEGRLEVNDSRTETKEVAQEILAKKKAKRQPKTVQEAEDGGEV